MITCRVLGRRESRLYEYFLRERNLDTRSMYFGCPIADESITKLVDHMITNSENHRIIVAEDDRFETIATVHMAQMDEHEMELGFMVAEQHRKLGIASEMMDFAMTWCRNRGFNDIFMHCLNYNAPIKHLVRKHGLEITSEGADADARVTLPKTNIFSIGHEMLFRQQNLFNTNVKHNIQSFRRAIV